jgi:hypothetical protein
MRTALALALATSILAGCASAPPLVRFEKPDGTEFSCGGTLGLIGGGLLSVAAYDSCLKGAEEAGYRRLPSK